MLVGIGVVESGSDEHAAAEIVVDALDEELQHGGLAIAANVAAKTTTD